MTSNRFFTKRTYQLFLMTALTLSFITTGAYADSWMITTQYPKVDKEENYPYTRYVDGLEISSTGKLLMKAGSEVRVTNDIVLAGGSIALAGEIDEDGDEKISRLTQTAANSTQGLLLRNGASISAAVLSEIDLKSKLDLKSGSSLTLEAELEENEDEESSGKGAVKDCAKLTTTSDVFVDNSSITTFVSAVNIIEQPYGITAKSLNVSNGSSLVGRFDIANNTSISDSTVSGGAYPTVIKSAADVLIKDTAISGALIQAGKGLTLDNLGGAQISGSTFSASEDMVFNSSATSTYLQARNITLDGNLTGGINASNLIDFKSAGTHRLYGDGSFGATTAEVRKDTDLTLYWGTGGVENLNVAGALTMTNYKLTDSTTNINFSGIGKGMADATANAGKLTLNWNNEINGNLTVSDNAEMTMIKNTTTDGWLKLHNFSIEKSQLNLDSAYISAIGSSGNNGTIDIGDDTLVNIRVSGPKDDEGYNYGHFIANTINISTNNTMLNLTLDTGALAEGLSDTYKIFDATNLTGHFASLSKNNRYEFEYVGNGEYKITNTATAGDVAGGTTQDSQIVDMASAWLDHGSFTYGTPAYEMAQHLDTLSQTEGAQETFVAALDALAPTSSPYISTLVEDTTRQFYNVIGARLESADQWRFVSSYSNQSESQNSLWVQGVGSSSEYSHKKGFEIKNYGGAIGIDTDPCFGCRFGIAYAYTTSDIDGVNRTADADTHAGAVYADINGEKLYTRLIASYARTSFDEKKDVAGLMTTADYDVDAIAGELKFGYDLGPIKLTRRTRTGSFMPEIGARYLYLKQKEYTDSAEQRVEEIDATTLTGIAGIHYTINTRLGRSVVFYPDLKAAVTYDIIQDELENTVYLPNNYGYRITEKRMKKLGGELGAEIGFRFGGDIDLSLSYLGTFKKDYIDHTGFVNLKARF